jgi:imidazoleglycerol-phosphate dehydratase
MKNSKPAPSNRTAEIRRKTRETQVEVSLNLDGSGKTTLKTGVGFFDHMLDLLGRHALIDLNVQAQGDLEVDAHHTVEDVGLALGQALIQSLGDKRGIYRYGWAIVPMDESLAQVAIDLSGRPAFVFRVNFAAAMVTAGKMNLHISVPYGANNHHIAEAIFKATAKALRQAVSLDDRNTDIPSTKGTLDA